MQKLKRKSGILLHPTSLPSPYGIGDLGTGAYEFIDFLEASGQHLWQTLPLTHTGFGDSPYQGFSAFAGQPYLISPEHFVEQGLLEEQALWSCPCENPNRIDYGTIIQWKNHIFHLAYERWLNNPELPKKLKEDFKEFCEEQAFWLDDYAIFMACKDINDGKCWLEWDDEMRLATAEDRKKLMFKYKEEATFYKFLQFFFFTEWNNLKEYANEHHVKIIGDIPIFVSMDSADAWANQGLFQLDTKGFPTVVAGVPPDYFSATGQLWGNPLYDWKKHQATGFAWWISRISSQLKMFDILRIDHFRGFEAYWAVPYGDENAIGGKWIKAPGKELFTAVKKSLGENLPIIAEDLGIITDEVTELRDYFQFPGMKILQFAFNSTDEGDYLPHNFDTPRCVCYTGTHDNDTTNGWYTTVTGDARKRVQDYCGCYNEYDIAHEMIRLCSSSIAAYAIYPLQDLLRLGTEGRMNTPGVGAGNWNWRYRSEELNETLAAKLRYFTRLYGRL